MTDLAEAAATAKRLYDLVEGLSSTVGLHQDAAKVKALKTIAKQSDANVQTVFDAIIARLPTKHAQVRYLLILLTHQLFMRSKVFRHLLVPHHLERVLQLSICYHPRFPPPPPSGRATLLRETTLECLEEWTIAYGIHLPMLIVARKYLHETLKLKLPGRLERETARERERRERTERAKAIHLEKYEQVQQGWEERRQEIEGTLKELEEAIAELQEDRAQRKQSAEHSCRGPGQDVDTRGSKVTTLKALGLEESDEEDEEFEENEEDVGMQSLGRLELRVMAKEAEADVATHQHSLAAGPVVDSIRELLSVISDKYLPCTQEWIATVTRADPINSSARDELLKGIIDLRAELRAAVQKCQRHGIEPSQRKQIIEEQESRLGEGATGAPVKDEQIGNVRSAGGHTDQIVGTNPTVSDRTGLNPPHVSKEEDVLADEVFLKPLFRAEGVHSSECNRGGGFLLEDEGPSDSATNSSWLLNPAGSVRPEGGGVCCSHEESPRDAADIEWEVEVWRESPLGIGEGPTQDNGTNQKISEGSEVTGRGGQVGEDQALRAMRQDGGAAAGPLSEQWGPVSAKSEAVESLFSIERDLASQAVSNVRKRDRERMQRPPAVSVGGGATSTQPLPAAQAATRVASGRTSAYALQGGVNGMGSGLSLRQQVVDHNTQALRTAGLEAAGMAFRNESGERREGVVMGIGGRARGKGRGGELAAMLKKKETARDRLAKRLLKGQRKGGR